MVLVDSSVWIELFRGSGNLLVSLSVENLLEEGQAAVCGVVKLELLGGAREQERVTVANLFSLVPYLSQNEGHWEETIRFQRKCRKQGITIPWSDALIAALARKNEVRVYAQDRHFECLEAAGLIQLYHPGPGGAYAA